MTGGDVDAKRLIIAMAAILLLALIGRAVRS